MGRPERNRASQQQPTQQPRRLLRSSSSQQGVVAGVATGVVVLAAVVIVLLVLLLRRRAREARRRRTSPAEGPPPLKRFSYRELKRATGGFSEASKIGQGGFGSVFRGTLRGGRLVAVKRLDTASLQGEREFTNELTIVSRVMGSAGVSTPTNVVALLGYCDSKRKMLVYEYMENRSLQEALFSGEAAATGRRRPTTALEWGKRVGVLLDVARALAFLHKCDPVIIHGDVKPSNVLLDAGFGAKLADFGLARIKVGGDGDVEEETTVVVDEERRPRQRPRTSRRWRSSAVVGGGGGGGDSDQQQQSDEPGVAEDSPSEGAQPSPPPQQQSPQPVSLSQSPVATSEVAAAAEDDDWMSKASGYEGTEPDTWSKLSPSEVDWRSEVSLDSGRRGGSRRYFWKKSKKSSAATAVPMPPGDWWPDNVASTTTSSGGGIKGYLVDWVSCERGRSRTRDGPATTDGKKKKQARSGSLEWWAECEDSGDSGELMRRMKSEQKKKQQQQQRLQQQESFSMPMSRENSREWWRPNNVGRSASEESFTFYQHNQQNKQYHSGEIPISGGSDMLAAAAIAASDGGRRRVRTRSREWWSGEMQRGREWWSGELGRRTAKFFDSHSGELSKSKRRQRRRSSQEWWSGELGTTMSSTPSMRGTVCYVAPEQGGGAGGAAMATEKVDVYSFGVLCLVVVSGRRPLQVVATPMSEFERANLVSWARAAARAGRPLDIVDPALRGELDELQATGIISLALQCLQRSPQLRPSMSDAVRVLAGETEPPPLPLEFSPSPPAKASSSSSKRKNGAVTSDVPTVDATATPG